MSQRYESQFAGHNSEELFLQSWLIDQPKGNLLVTHGLAEHSDCYNDFAAHLNSKGWNIWSWDLPGHGRSSGKRGYIDHFQSFVDDLTRVIAHLKQQQEHPIKNLFLFGHSLGGLITFLQAANTKAPLCEGVILSSPAFGLSLEVPKFKSFAAKMLMKCAPKVTLFNEVDHNLLVRDEGLVSKYALDHLRHDKISASVFLGMLEGFEQAQILASEFDQKLLLILGGQDSITDSRVSEQLFKAIPSKSKKLFWSPNSYHEVFNDFDKEEAFECLLQFLESTSSHS